MKMSVKKLGIVVLCIAMLIFNLAVMSGCQTMIRNIFQGRTEYEEGDFKYKSIDDWGMENPYVSITGLTEEGETKETLIVPDTIRGHPVTKLDVELNDWYSYAEWRSENLKTLYLPRWMYLNTVFRCPNWKRVFILSAKNEDNYNFDISRKVEETYLCGKQYFELEEVYRRSYPANIKYDYNYEESPNDGYYWIANLGDGEKITYIPEEPKREGYEFAGWYKEKECVNKWDFNNDTVTVYEYEKYEEETFYENVLYAKWLAI